MLGVGPVDDGLDAAGAGVDGDAGFGLIVDLAVPGVDGPNGCVVPASGEPVLDELAGELDQPVFVGCGDNQLDQRAPVLPDFEDHSDCAFVPEPCGSSSDAARFGEAERR